MEKIAWIDFQKVDIRTGTILKARDFPEARNPSYLLEIDFGPLGVMKSSAQITVMYQPDQLVGKQVVAVVNFPPRQIAHHMSQCLVLGVPGEDGSVSLLSPEHRMDNGLKVS